MYACYIDESGHCGKKYNPDQPVEVLAGVLIDLSKLSKTQREHRFILQFLNKRGISLNELKAKDLYNGNGSWEKLDYKIRHRIINFILNWMDKRACRIIVCPIDCEIFFQKKRAGCIISKKLCYPYEVGSINIILAVQKLQKNREKNKGKTFLIFDEQKGQDENVLRLLEGDLSFTDGYTIYEKNKKVERLNCILDVPFFSKSHLSIIIQLADISAFIVNKYLSLRIYGKEEKYPNKIEEWYKLIKKRLVSHTAIDPPPTDEFCKYFRELRPKGWSAKKWLI